MYECQILLNFLKNKSNNFAVLKDLMERMNKDTEKELDLFKKNFLTWIRNLNDNSSVDTKTAKQKIIHYNLKRELKYTINDSSKINHILLDLAAVFSNPNLPLNGNLPIIEINLKNPSYLLSGHRTKLKRTTILAKVVDGFTIKRYWIPTKYSDPTRATRSISDHEVFESELSNDDIDELINT